MTDIFTDLVQRFRKLQANQDNSSELIKDILVYAQDIKTSLRQENVRLNDRLRESELDLSDATQSRRELQQRMQKYESQIQYISNENDSLKNRNPYVLILIDGDGLLFQEHLIRERVEGGKKAAYALRAAVAKHVGERADELEIVARVVANVTGLGKAMLRDGSLDNSSDFKDFTLGFTQAKASFDFIDVGYGKERADSKIKETCRWHMRNHNCQEIFLGISHDAGYAPFLDEVLRDEASRQRISVLEGYPTVRELRETKVNVVQFGGDLFRKTKLSERSAINSPPKAQNSTPGVLTPATSNASPSPPLASAIPVTPATPATTATTATTATSTSAAPISNASPPPQLVIPLAPRTPKHQPQALKWNPGPRGYDESLSANQQVMEDIKRRNDGNKLCNNHYLRGSCEVPNCIFVHHEKVSHAEISALRMLARLIPCRFGQDCSVKSCIHGHHCPSVKNSECNQLLCRFSVSAHPPRTSFKNRNIRDNIERFRSTL